MNELKNRGVEDVLIAVVDGLKGFPEAITAVFPQTIVQTCIVHLIRNSMDFASWKDRRAIAAELKKVYRAADADAGQAALEAFDAGPWGKKYPSIAQDGAGTGRRSSRFSPPMRRIIYTTNAIESLNAKLRRAIRTKGHFPTDDSAMKLLYLVLRQVAAEWKMPPREWCEAKNQFAIMFEGRFPRARLSTDPAHKIPDSPPRAAQRLAIHGHDLARERAERRSSGAKALSQRRRIEQTKHLAQGLRARHAVFKWQKLAEPVESALGDLFNAFPIVRSANDADQRRQQNLVQRIGHHARHPVIRHDSHMVQKALRHGALLPRPSNPLC